MVGVRFTIPRRYVDRHRAGNAVRYPEGHDIEDTAANTEAYTLSPTEDETATLTLTPPPTASPTPSNTPLLTKTESLTPSLQLPPTRTATDTATKSETNTEGSPSSSNSLSLDPVGCPRYLTLRSCRRDAWCYPSRRWGACVNTTLQQYLTSSIAVDGGDAIPQYVRTGNPVDVTLWGGAALGESIATLWPADDGTACPAATEAIWTDKTKSVAVVVSTSDAVGGAAPFHHPNSTFFSFPRLDPGFTPADPGRHMMVCLLLTGQGGNVVVSTGVTVDFSFSPEPVITTCAMATSELFTFSTTDIVFRGYNLGADDYFKVVPASTLTCPEDLLAYSKLSSVASPGNGTVGRFRVEDARGVYRACYRGPSGSAAYIQSCDERYLCQGRAPWVNPPNLTIAALRGPRLLAATGGESLDVTQFNLRHCKSLRIKGYTMPPSFENAPLIHVTNMAADFGSLTQPFDVAEVCAVLMRPFYDPLVTQKAIAVKLDMLFMDRSDIALVYVPTEAAWRDGPLLNRGEITRSASLSKACPAKSIAGWVLVDVVTGLGVASTFEYRVNKDHGVLVVLCSDAVREGGLMASVSYHVDDTVCPNNCRDKGGVTRGECIVATHTCTCHEYWIGKDCSTYSGCVGYDDKSAEVTDSSAVLYFTHDDTPTTPCGYVVTVTDATLDRKDRFGIAFQIQNSTLSSLDCRVSYVFVRHNGPKGRLLARYCSSDFEDPLKVHAPFLLNDTKRIYVQFGAAFAGEGFRLQFMAVALGCPGEVDATGYVGKPCHDHGRCVPFSYTKLTQLLPSSKTCVCAMSYGAKLGGSCDMCAFGYKPWSYPNCSLFDVCPLNCSSHGECTADGCICDAMHFGRACEMPYAIVEVNSKVLSRFPFDNATSGDAADVGRLSRSYLSCEGQPGRCVVASRQRGKVRPLAIELEGEDTESNSTRAGRRQEMLRDRRMRALEDDDDESGRRRQVVDTNSFRGIDTGVSLNAFSAIEGTAGDYLRRLNVSGTIHDVNDMFSVAAWVRVTQETKGVLIAKADAAFFSDGTNPVLDAALEDSDVESFTSVREENLRSSQTSLRCIFAVIINGPRRRVSLFISDPSVQVVDNSSDGVPRRRGGLTLRHFRLGDKAKDLFDGSWRYLVVRFERGSQYNSSVIYIDGYTVTSSPDYLQCLPSLVQKQPRTLAGPYAPGTTSARLALLNASMDSGYDSDASLVTDTYPNGAFVVGYRFQGAIDELRVYDIGISQPTIVDIGGQQFLGVLITNTDALYASATMAFLGAIVTVAAVVIVLWLRRRDERGDDVKRLQRHTIYTVSERELCQSVMLSNPENDNDHLGAEAGGIQDALTSGDDLAAAPKAKEEDVQASRTFALSADSTVHSATGSYFTMPGGRASSAQGLPPPDAMDPLTWGVFMDVPDPARRSRALLNFRVWFRRRHLPSSIHVLENDAAAEQVRFDDSSAEILQGEESEKFVCVDGVERFVAMFMGESTWRHKTALLEVPLLRLEQLFNCRLDGQARNFATQFTQQPAQRVTIEAFNPSGSVAVSTSAQSTSDDDDDPFSTASRRTSQQGPVTVGEMWQRSHHQAFNDEPSTVTTGRVVRKKQQPSASAAPVAASGASSATVTAIAQLPPSVPSEPSTHSVGGPPPPPAAALPAGPFASIGGDDALRPVKSSFDDGFDIELPELDFFLPPKPPHVSTSPPPPPPSLTAAKVGVGGGPTVGVGSKAPLEASQPTSDVLSPTDDGGSFEIAVAPSVVGPPPKSRQQENGWLHTGALWDGTTSGRSLARRGSRAVALEVRSIRKALAATGIPLPAETTANRLRLERLVALEQHVRDSHHATDQVGQSATG